MSAYISLCRYPDMNCFATCPVQSFYNVARLKIQCSAVCLHCISFFGIFFRGILCVRVVVVVVGCQVGVASSIGARRLCMQTCSHSANHSQAAHPLSQSFIIPAVFRGFSKLEMFQFTHRQGKQTGGCCAELFFNFILTN